MVLAPGLRSVERIVVAGTDTAVAMGSGDVPVLGTPRYTTWSDRTLASATSMSLARHQLRRITRGQDPTGATHPLRALVCDQRTNGARSAATARGWRPGSERLDEDDDGRQRALGRNGQTDLG